MDQNQNYNPNINQNYNPNFNPNYNQNMNNAAPEKAGPSGLSIAALIFAFLLSPIGLVLGIVDLFKKDGRTKGLSIAAIIVSIVMGFISFIVCAVLLAVIYPQAARYEQKSRIASDAQLCASVRTAIITSMMDPEVITGSDPGLPAYDEWIYVEDIDDDTDFGKAFEEYIGRDTDEIEGDILSSYGGGDASGIQFRISNGNDVEVRIENSDDGNGNRISAGGYNYY
ncbi:MAG: hypothetical protein IKO53_01805 [Lachnospiraceae bacterium]|nr:hypothetical protein [Lachnospiraceae bacterium]